MSNSLVQSAITLSAPVTVGGAITTNTARDWVDYALAFGSIGSIFVGLFAVWLAAKWAKEADLLKRYLDIVISKADAKYSALTPLINQMNTFVQILEFGILKNGTTVRLSWNEGDAQFHDNLLKALEEFNGLSRGALQYQSSNFQPYVEIFRIKFDEVAINVDGTPKVVTLEKWQELIDFQRNVIKLAATLIGLETNRKAMNVLEENDPKGFYKLLEENAVLLKKHKEETRPFVDQLRQIIKTWRK